MRNTTACIAVSKTLKRSMDIVLPDSPTQRVGAPSSEKFDKIRHTEPMLSLDNAFSYDELREFDRKLKTPSEFR